jgi:hypothetical protein
VESPAPFAKPLALGDRITISGRDGRDRQLEVADLKPLGEVHSRVSTGLGQARLLLVTCRVIGAKQDDAPVRFIIEAGSTELSAPQPAKAL